MEIGEFFDFFHLNDSSLSFLEGSEAYECQLKKAVKRFYGEILLDVIKRSFIQDVFPHKQKMVKCSALRKSHA